MNCDVKKRRNMASSKKKHRIVRLILIIATACYIALIPIYFFFALMCSFSPSSSSTWQTILALSLTYIASAIPLISLILSWNYFSKHRYRLSLILMSIPLILMSAFYLIES